MNPIWMTPIDDDHTEIPKKQYNEVLHCFRAMNMVTNHGPEEVRFCEEQPQHYDGREPSPRPRGTEERPRLLSRDKSFRDASMQPKSNPTGSNGNGWDNNCSSNGATWTLGHLEFYYPLATTRITFDAAELPMVVTRLQHAFRGLSLAVVYSNNPLSATCTSMEQVTLSLHFWEARKEDDDNDGNQVILEIMRTAGDTLISCQYIRDLLDVAAGRCEIQDEDVMMYDNDEEELPLSASEMVGKVDRLMRCQLPDTYDDDEQVRQEYIHEALDIAGSLLDSDRTDAGCLGLETLAILTDVNKTGVEPATTVARNILMSTRNSPWHAQEVVLELALTGHWPSEQGTRTTTIITTVDHKATAQAYYLAWTILAQSLSLLTTCEITSFLQNADAYLCQRQRQRQEQYTMMGKSRFVDFLVSNMNAAAATNTTTPESFCMSMHTACWATHILALLCHSIATIRSSVSLHEVQHVQQIGLRHHAALSHAVDHLTRNLAVVSAH